MLRNAVTIDSDRENTACRRSALILFPNPSPLPRSYTKAIDPNSQILQDIATRCGFIGDTKSNIKVNYDLTLRMKIVLFTISPTFSSSTSFACPLSQSDIQGLVGGTSLGGLLGGGS